MRGEREKKRIHYKSTLKCHIPFNSVEKFAFIYRTTFPDKLFLPRFSLVSSWKGKKREKNDEGQARKLFPPPPALVSATADLEETRGMLKRPS